MKEVLIPGYPASSLNLIFNKKNPNCLIIVGSVKSGGECYFGIYFSTDGGDHWTPIKINSQNNSIAATVAIDPTNNNTLYVGGYNSSWNPLLYKSTNGGASWADITGGIQGEVRNVAVDPSSPNIIYVSTSFGIWKSENSGSSWIKTNAPSGNCVLINPSNPNEVFAGGYNGVYYSQDKGNTWQEFNTGLIITEVRWLDLNPASRILFAATWGGGVFKTKF